MNARKMIRPLLAISTLSTVGLYTYNKITEQKSREQLPLDSKVSCYHWRYGEIPYKKQGIGSSVLLVHDVDCSSSSVEWSNIIRSLSESRTVYALDLLGCGLSDKPYVAYTNFLYVQLIRDFIHDVIGSDADVICSGLSSSIAIMADKYDDQLFKKITMINPPSISSLHASPTLWEKMKCFILKIPVWGTSFYHVHYTKDIITLTFLEKYYANSSNVDSNVIDSYYHSANQSGRRSKYLYNSIVGGLLSVDILPSLLACNKELCILYSTGNTNYINIAEQYKAHRENIKIKAVASAMQLPHLECPSNVLSLLQ